LAEYWNIERTIKMNENNNVLISVIIPTYNRFQCLQEALESLLAQDKDETLSYEVIVVDNNSNDYTKNIVDSFMNLFKGNLRYTFEAKRGIPYARNKGIREAVGEILVCIDDDVIVHKDWLRNIKKYFDLYPDIAGIAGRIIPNLRCKKPCWLSINGDYLLKGALNYYDHGDTPFYTNNIEKPFMGANMALRRAVFEKHGLFHGNIKKIGNKLLFTEDTELYRRIKEKGERVLYAPEVVVEHPFDKNRINKRYFRRWYYYTGISNAIVGPNIEAKKIYKIPLWLIREIIEDFLRAIKNYLLLQFSKAFYYEANLFFNLGQAKGYLIQKKFKPADWKKV